MKPDLNQVIAEELELDRARVARTVELLDDGNTIPFIARYRKELTGSLNEELLRRIEERLTYLRKLEARKSEVVRFVAEQDKLTPQLQAEFEAATTLQELEDLYRPYRPKRRTRAEKARQQGLEPLAELLWNAATGQAQLREEASALPQELAHSFVSAAEGVNTVDEALAGARDIIAERIADDPDLRGFVRRWTLKHARLHSTVKSKDLDRRSPYEMYYDYAEPVTNIKPHRILAINRGESEELLTVRLDLDTQQLLARLEGQIIHGKHPSGQEVRTALHDAYRRLLGPSIERELRSRLTEEAEDHAIKVFTDNLEHLLLQAPVRGKIVLGVDPAYRTGCKVAVVDSSSQLLDVTVVYPTPPRNDVDGARETVLKLITEHDVELIAIGNGTASRETEAFIAEVVRAADAQANSQLHYTIVNEAGASVYSASPLAREEFPELDVSERSAVSIARRLQDPLAELVKIEPRSIGVGQYQHDVDQKKLAEALDFVVELCVNRVGVELHTASAPLLERVSGIGPATAQGILEYRRDHGFGTRSDLLEVRGIGPKTFEQCAGFLRLPEGQEPLDATAIHPESYAAAYALLERVGASPEDVARGGLPDIDKRLRQVEQAQLTDELGIGLPTLQDIVDALKHPGRDPREDMPGPLFRTDVLSLDDLELGMLLTGTVRNVVDFGAFVDIGVKRDGLVHSSELQEGYVRHPSDVVSVGDVVRVMVLDIERERERISLTMRNIKQP